MSLTPLLACVLRPVLAVAAVTILALFALIIAPRPVGARGLRGCLAGRSFGRGFCNGWCRLSLTRGTATGARTTLAALAVLVTAAATTLAAAFLAFSTPFVPLFAAMVPARTPDIFEFLLALGWSAGWSGLR